MSVASRTSELRKAFGLTQQAFADRLGITRGAVANWDLDRSDPSELSELNSALSKSRDLRKKLGLALGSLASKG